MRGVTAMEDVALLSVAIVGLSLFVASILGAQLAHEARERGERLQAEAETFLEAVLEDRRWTVGRGLLLAEALNRTTTEDVRPLALGRPFRLAVWDVVAGTGWTFAKEGGGDFRTAATSANVVGSRTNPARVTAMVWEF
ncbi:MAG: hypothetical protein HY557_00170 [Euryarchaeota archaeon]|nr:hypothetical protein [Euryarchaeota archaeon]